MILSFRFISLFFRFQTCFPCYLPDMVWSQYLISKLVYIIFVISETTSSGLVTTLAYLSIYQDEQEKVFNEISRVLTEKDPSVSNILEWAYNNYIKAFALRKRLFLMISSIHYTVFGRRKDFVVSLTYPIINKCSSVNIQPNTLAAAAFIPRQLTADIDVNISHPSPQTLHLRKGSLIMFDLVGICEFMGLR